MRAPPQQGAHRADTFGAGIRGQRRPGSDTWRYQPGIGITNQSEMSAGRMGGPPRQETRTRPGYFGNRGRPAEQPRGHRRSPRAVAQRMRELHDGDGAEAADARNVVHRGEHVQPPGHPAHIQLLAGEADNGRQTTLPAAIGQVVADQLVTLHGCGHPLRVGQSTTVLNSHP
ncbi:Uncharacterised protein [Mycobacterium tuberculosis]|uniref:Uncharacterized protein n=2 Tax=Mycobacterium tuberculosis TaxID=1773 RepID=A0A654ZNS3_MYCTX|nr:Uncharacterised protein [Mycobacterium tuberculosis]CKS14700.1 Uncharacterised protein [Mycobacterium tuberculosis]CKT47726.1 Uncharacterised protein [Mycobacterium tuberculosis]CNM11351.1 Uncharacterised protein [Mycobacterium tuberculosis]COV73593.1 Uncharacterised protein [Mycobacterium tuberculosis]